MLWTYFPTFVALFSYSCKWTLFPSGRFFLVDVISVDVFFNFGRLDNQQLLINFGPKLLKYFK